MADFGSMQSRRISNRFGTTAFLIFWAVVWESEREREKQRAADTSTMRHIKNQHTTFQPDSDMIWLYFDKWLSLQCSSLSFLRLRFANQLRKSSFDFTHSFARFRSQMAIWLVGKIVKFVFYFPLQAKTEPFARSKRNKNVQFLQFNHIYCQRQT